MRQPPPSGVRPHRPPRSPQVTMRHRMAAFAWILSVAMLGGCSSSAIVGDDPNTGVILTVFRGPIEPVGMEGEDNSEPVPGAVLEVERIDSRKSISLTTGGDGKASETVAAAVVTRIAQPAQPIVLLPAVRSKRVGDRSCKVPASDNPAGSTGQRNIFIEYFCWRMKGQRLSRPLVELKSSPVQICV